MPPVHDVRRLSYSALALFERCSYRYFAERVLGLPPPPPTEPERRIRRARGHRARRRGPSPARARAARRPGRTSARGARPHRARVVSGGAGRGARADRCDSSTRTAARRSRGASPMLRGARPERPFIFEHDGVVLRGRLDVLWREGDRALVVDYKSNALEGREPAEIIDAEYVLQRLVYALVCLRAGATEVEVAYQFLERPADVVSTTFTLADVRRPRDTAVGRDRPDPRRGLPPDAERVRRARTARRSTSSAPGRASRSRASLARCLSPRSATSMAIPGPAGGDRGSRARRHRRRRHRG